MPRNRDRWRKAPGRTAECYGCLSIRVCVPVDVRVFGVWRAKFLCPECRKAQRLQWRYMRESICE